MSLGIKIKELRSKVGITQRKLAEQLNVTAQAVSRWESDEVEPSIDTLKKMASIFNVTIDELLDNKTEPKVVEKVVEVEKQVVVEKPIIVEKQVVVEKPVEQKTVLGICSFCNKPIYYENELLVKHLSGRGWTKDAYYHKKCDAIIKENKRQETIKDNEKRFKKSFIWGGLAGILVAALLIWGAVAGGNTGPLDIFIGIGFGVATFTMISCFILGHNFLFDSWSSVAGWSVKFPGVIFSLDLNGLIFLIAVKLLFVVLGALIASLSFIIATLIALPLSIFVYPYALYANIKKRDIPAA